MKISNEDDAHIQRLKAVAASIMEFLPDEDAETPSYYVRVSKQTSEPKNGGYAIDSLSEQSLLYFTAQCFIDAAEALRTY